MNHYDAQNQPGDLFSRYGLYEKYDAPRVATDLARAQSHAMRQAARQARPVTPKGPLLWRRLWIVGLLELIYVAHVYVPAAASGYDIDYAPAMIMLWTAFFSFAISIVVFYVRKDDESGGRLSAFVRLGLGAVGTAYLGYKVGTGVARHIYRDITRD